MEQLAEGQVADTGSSMEYAPVDTTTLIGAATLIVTAIGVFIAFTDRRHDREGSPQVVPASSALAVLEAGDPPLAEFDGAHLDEMRRILSQHVFASPSGRMTIGVFDRVSSSVFLDLFSAATKPAHRETIASSLASSAPSLWGAESPTHVAVPKEGNVLLADAVARTLGLELIVVRTRVPAIRFGDPIEGSLPSGALVLLVDDVATDGEMLVRAIRALRKHGARVSRCLCAVERLDGNARARLGDCEVSLHASIQVDEAVLRHLAELPPEALVGTVA
jgi:orotate phosphoribosyltransferase